MQVAGRVVGWGKQALGFGAEEVGVEVHFGAGRVVLHSRQRLFVGEAGRASREGTLVVDVVDAFDERVGSGFALVEAAEGFDFARQALDRRRGGRGTGVVGSRLASAGRCRRVWRPRRRGCDLWRGHRSRLRGRCGSSRGA